jgi:hypothetical protein
MFQKLFSQQFHKNNNFEIYAKADHQLQPFIKSQAFYF